MTNEKIKLKNDKYRKVRGGYSRLLELECSNCKSFLFNYQKDGPGILKRLYIDRIQNLEETDKKLICKKCSKVLGNLGVYKKESRPAYILIPGSIAKKIIRTA